MLANVKHIGPNRTPVILPYQTGRPNERRDEFGNGLSRNQLVRCGWIVNRFI
jgi:hypothetical protein